MRGRGYWNEHTADLRSQLIWRLSKKRNLVLLTKSVWNELLGAYSAEQAPLHKTRICTLLVCRRSCRNQTNLYSSYPNYRPTYDRFLSPLYKSRVRCTLLTA